MTTEISLRTFAYLLRVAFETFLPLLFVQSQIHSLFLEWRHHVTGGAKELSEEMELKHYTPCIMQMTHHKLLNLC